MRGIPNHNFEAFHNAAKHLRDQGFDVWSPAENDVMFCKDCNGKGKIPVFESRDGSMTQDCQLCDGTGTKQKFSFGDAMARDLPEVCKSDAVAVLRGWENSQGARLETNLAWELGKDVVDAFTLELVERPQICRDLKPTNPKDCMAVDKLSMSLVPDTAEVFLALAFTEGHLKYGGFNWRKTGVLYSVYQDAIKRHSKQAFNGEWADAKTKVPHLASVMACCAIILDAHVCGKLRDDRPLRCDITKLLEEVKEITTNLKAMFPGGPGKHTES